MPGPYDKFESSFEAFQAQLRQELHEELATFKQDLLTEVKQITGAEPFDEAGLRQWLAEQFLFISRRIGELMPDPVEVEEDEPEEPNDFEKEVCKVFGIKEKELRKVFGIEEKAIPPPPPFYISCWRCGHSRENVVNTFCKNCGAPLKQSLPDTREDVSGNDHHPEQDNEDTKPFTF